MAVLKSRLTSLTDSSALATINKLFDSVSDTVDKLTVATKTKRIGGRSTLVFGTISAGSCVDAVANILGASTNLVAHANPLLPLGSTNLTWSTFVSGANQVTVRVCNPTSSPITTNTTEWNILVA